MNSVFCATIVLTGLCMVAFLIMTSISINKYMEGRKVQLLDIF
jgi:hypothetical protein